MTSNTLETRESRKPNGQSSNGPDYGAIAVLLGLTGALLWSYWPALGTMAHAWQSDPQYSHGWIVPVFAAVLLWLRRDQLDALRLRANWWGIALLTVAVSLKLVAGWYYMEWFDLVSFVPALGGVVLLVGGRRAFLWALPAVAFLFFMVPLPHTLAEALREPLRGIGTVASTYIMQTFGLPAYSEGFLIVVGEMPINVAEVCSGLNMLVTFFALSTAVAILSDERPLWERFLIVASAVPIAVAANVVRITVTGMFYASGAEETARRFMHDFSGYLMMLLGLALLWVELKLLSALFVVEHIRPLDMGLKGESGSNPAQDVNARNGVAASAQG